MGNPAKPVEDALPESDEPEPSPEQLAELEAAWEQEILWRAREHEEGRAKSVPWEQVRAEIFGKRG